MRLHHATMRRHLRDFLSRLAARGRSHSAHDPAPARPRQVPHVQRQAWALLTWGVVISLPAHAAHTAATPESASLEVSQLSLEELLNIEVTTVSRKSQRLSDTAAAAFVLTADDIQRSGATSVPEALRLVPGVEVARIGSGRWAVTARGFNSRFANKLLVLIDGRSVYSPLFSGVFWEAEDVLLDDVERIEVIRGSGAALWGANAVNGIINIVTRPALRTQGTLVSTLAGNEDRGQIGLRHGWMADADTAMRIWAKAGERQRVLDAQDERTGAAWDYQRAGLRLDRDTASGGHLLLTGDVQTGHSGETLIAASLSAPYAQDVETRQSNDGGSLLGRYEWTTDSGNPASVQAYVSRDGIRLDGVLNEHRTTVDLDFQTRLPVSGAHDVIWGGGMRHSQDNIQGGPVGTIAVAPARRRQEMFSLFVHDEYTLVPDTWKLIAGGKAEHNSYTGMEWQPNVRALWTPDPHQSAWAALSRAVRTPSRAERDFAINLQTLPPNSASNPSPFPVLVHVLPGTTLQSEKVVTAEVGYRRQWSATASLDVTAYRSQYRDLRAGYAVDQTVVGQGSSMYIVSNNATNNGLSAHANGLEAVMDWYPTTAWRLQATYSWLHLRVQRSGEAAGDSAADNYEGNSPKQQLGLRSLLDLPGNAQLDLRVKRVGPRPLVGIGAYTEFDARWAWRITPQCELSVVGQNLLGAHVESNSDPLPSMTLKIPRSAYIKARWQF
jgi:iron complex outermembrane receptor protein